MQEDVLAGRYGGVAMRLVLARLVSFLVAGGEGPLKAQGLLLERKTLL